LADATKNLEVISTNGQQYLSEKIDFYVDDVLTDSLNIGADLKGRASTDIEISGSGAGITQQEAINDALNNMKRMQTILIAGSLPVKLNIVQIDTISPTLGKEFIRSTLLLAIFASIAVSLLTRPTDSKSCSDFTRRSSRLVSGQGSSKRLSQTQKLVESGPAKNPGD
jgi:preprotein translocase subunit SecD